MTGAAAKREAPTIGLSELLDAAPEIFAWLRLDGTITYISGAAEELVGRPPDELVGTPGPELFDDVDRPEIERKLAALATGPVGEQDRITVRIRRPDGSLVWADVGARIAEDPQTGELGFAAVVWESGDRVETERALRRVEDRFRQMIELLPVVVYEAEPGAEGRFLYVSPQIEQMLGYTADEWTADPTLWAARIHPDDRARTFESEVQQAIMGRRSDEHLASEYRLLRRNGEVVWVRDVARLCKPASGPVFWRGVMLDVGSERVARQTLEDAYERHRGIVEGLPACAYRAEAGVTGQWLFVSGHVQRLLGYRPEELVTDPTLWAASLHADDRERVVAMEEQFAELEEPGAELTQEYRMRRRTGETVWVRDRAVLVEDASGRRLIDGIITDISPERAIREAGDALIDVYRLTCGACGSVWPSDTFEACPRCGDTDVDGVSLNAALGDLATSRRQVEGLLDGIHKHLEALGTNLRTGSASLGVAPEG
jgi:PAS domain S-box-containing protein